jgi:O-antigen/teichoic acid export membrane protein
MIERARAAILAISPKTAFARSVSVLVGGTAGAQLIAVLAAPLLTRLFTPKDFGLLAVYASLLALIGVVSSLRYELAIPLPEEDGEAANVTVLSLLLVSLTTVLSSLLVGMFATPIADALGAPALADYLWLVPVGVLLAGGYNVFNYWSVRTKRFSAIASTRICQSLTTLAIQIAVFKLGGLALLLGQVAGQSIGIISLSRPALAMRAFRQVSWSGIWQVAVHYRQFPIFSTWGGFVDTASTKLPLIVFFTTFGPSMAGFLTIADRVLQMPASLIGRAVSQVFYSNAAEAHKSGELSQLVERIFSKLVHIGFPPALLIFLTAPDLFEFVFGENWRQAGKFASWMTPWLFLQFASSPLSIIFVITEKMGQSLVWQIILLGFNLSALLVGVLHNDSIKAIMILSGANIICYLILIIWIARLTNNSLITLSNSLLNAGVIAIICATPILIVTLITENSAIFLRYAFFASVFLVAARYFQILLTKPS